MEGKITALGDADFVKPFSAIGLETFEVSDQTQQIRDSAKKIIEKQYALVVVSEDVAEQAEEVFQAARDQAVPAILVMPFTTESSGYATANLGEAIKMATGVNILED